MIKVNDEIFSYGVNIDPNSYSHFGWEGNGAFAFDTYASGYKFGAEAIYERFCRSADNYAELDSLIYPLCFLYRHMMELLIKYLYIKHSHETIAGLTNFLKNNHDLEMLWDKTEPIIKQFQERVESTIDIDAITYYIKKMAFFDKNSFSMRYPVTKKLKATHSDTKLNVHILHDRMNEFYESIITLDSEIDNQILIDIEESEITRFLVEYKNSKEKIIEILKKEERRNKCEQKYKFCIANILSPSQDVIDAKESLDKTIKSLSDNQLTIIHALLYNRRDHYNLPKDPVERRLDYIKSAIIMMKNLNTPFDDNNINREDLEKPFFSKQPSRIIEWLGLAIDII